MEMGGPVFGKNGFFHNPSVTISTMDVGIIDQIVPSLLAQGIAKQEGDTVVLNAADLGVEKVLGSGRITKKISISAAAFSEQAKEKIEKIGGKALVV
jgi:large subunit ribosomal protein L15